MGDSRQKLIFKTVRRFGFFAGFPLTQQQGLTLLFNATTLTGVVKTTITPIILPSGSLMGAPLSWIGSLRPSRVIKTVWFCQPQHLSFALDDCERAFNGLTCIFVDDLKYFVKRFSAGSACIPSGNRCCGGVNKIHATIDVGSNHCVTDACERNLQQFSLFAQTLLRLATRTCKEHEADE